MTDKEHYGMFCYFLYWSIKTVILFNLYEVKIKFSHNTN